MNEAKSCAWHSAHTHTHALRRALLYLDLPCLSTHTQTSDTHTHTSDAHALLQSQRCAPVRNTVQQAVSQPRL